MEVRIGIMHSPRELAFETDATSDELRALVATGLSETDGIVEFSDTRGRQFLVPARSISFVEIGSDVSRRVGFVS